MQSRIDGLQHEEIAALAHELWDKKGQPEDSAGDDWLEAEQQLRKAEDSRRVLAELQAKAGSVQS